MKCSHFLTDGSFRNNLHCGSGQSASDTHTQSSSRLIYLPQLLSRFLLNAEKGRLSSSQGFPWFRVFPCPEGTLSFPSRTAFDLSPVLFLVTLHKRGRGLWFTWES